MIMKTTPFTFNIILPLMGSLFLLGCETGPDNPGYTHRGLARFPSSWTDTDEEDARKPAYAFARHGMFEEAQRIVEEGRDTQAHYDHGVTYYNYWKQHSSHAETGVTSSETMRDMANSLFDSNDARLQEVKRKAAAGDVESQEWLKQHGVTVEIGNEAARLMNNRE